MLTKVCCNPELCEMKKVLTVCSGGLHYPGTEEVHLLDGSERTRYVELELREGERGRTFIVDTHFTSYTYLQLQYDACSTALPAHIPNSFAHISPDSIVATHALPSRSPLIQTTITCLPQAVVGPGTRLGEEGFWLNKYRRVKLLVCNWYEHCVFSSRKQAPHKTNTQH